MKNGMLLDDVTPTSLLHLGRKPKLGRPRREIAECETPKIVGVLIGRLVDLSESGEHLVDFPGNPSAKPLAALSILALGKTAVGREVVLMFEEGDAHRPVVMGIIRPPVILDAETRGSRAVDMTVDGKRITLTAQDEILLRCGGASLTLRRNGRVVIRGAYVESRSKGTNRIKGGSVLIN